MTTLREHVSTQIDSQGVGYIEFSSPSHNALPSNLLQDIVDALTSLSEDEKCEVVVLKSGGDRTFCAGASFEELKAITNQEEGQVFFSGFANVINAIRTCKKLVIGRIQGKAVGGGVGIAAAADYCFATKYASIKLSELGIGIGPFVIGPAVTRKIGLAAFSQLSLDYSTFKSVDWCYDKGLYQQVFDSADEMDSHLAEFCETLSQTNPEARSEMKRMFWSGTEEWPAIMKSRATTSGKLVLSEFTKKALNKM